jgi:chromosome segregation ATPase
MRKTIMVAFAALLLTACQSKHEQLQKQISERKEALKEHQDSALTMSQADVERLDQELQKVSAQYEVLKWDAEEAHNKGTGTPELYERVTRLRLKRDSLQAQFDVACSKIKYIRRLQEDDLGERMPR